MSQPIHHVPGRIRVRCRAFRCQAERAHAAEQRLKAMAGVTQTRVTPHAGSITVDYDTTVLTRLDVLSVLEQVDCLEAAQATESYEAARPSSRLRFRIHR